MRGIGLIAAMTLVAGCEAPAPENEASANTAPPTQSPVETNTAVAAAPEPVAPADNAIATADPGAASACLMQGDDRLQVRAIRAVGTEPFWSARVEGRCVTYSTPEDQQGTRVWTRYSAGANGGGTWVGQLGGKGFEMKTRPEAGCSDGMSDKRYPIGVELTVGGEQRKGCAEPL